MNKNLKEILCKARCFDKKEKLEIINFLLENPDSSLEEVSKKLRTKTSTTYKYLQQMLKAEVITASKLRGKISFRVGELSLNIDNSAVRSLFQKAGNTENLIIFDVDDTLVRRSDIPKQLSEAGKNAINEAQLLMSEKGIPISLPPKELFSEKWIHEKYGNSIQWYISAWLSIAGLPDSKLKEQLVERHTKEYYKAIEITALNCELFPDVVPFLEKLKSRFYFAAISNSSKKIVSELLKNNGILNYFTKEGKILIIGGDEIPKSKETIEEVFRLAEISPRDSYLIGDTGGDIKAAREAGIPPNQTIIVYRNITPLENSRLIKPRAKIIESLNEINF